MQWSNESIPAIALADTNTLYRWSISRLPMATLLWLPGTFNEPAVLLCLHKYRIVMCYVAGDKPFSFYKRYQDTSTTTATTITTMTDRNGPVDRWRIKKPHLLIEHLYNCKLANFGALVIHMQQQQQKGKNILEWPLISLKE